MVTQTIPSAPPTKLVRGDSTKWTRAFAEYLPADGWTLTYYFVNADNRFSVVATNNGDGAFLVTVLTTDSAKFIKGSWSWQAVATKAGERVTLESGSIEIVDGFATASTGVDSRSWTRQALDAVESAILARAASGQVAMGINGRSVSWSSFSELLVLRDRLKQEIRTENAAAGLGGAGRDIRVRYGVS